MQTISEYFTQVTDTQNSVHCKL